MEGGTGKAHHFMGHHKPKIDSDVVVVEFFVDVYSNATVIARIGIRFFLVEARTWGASGHRHVVEDLRAFTAEVSLGRRSTFFLSLLSFTPVVVTVLVTIG